VRKGKVEKGVKERESRGKKRTTGICKREAHSARKKGGCGMEKAAGHFSKVLKTKIKKGDQGISEKERIQS